MLLRRTACIRYYPEVTLESGLAAEYQVSSAIEYGPWTVLGSPFDVGLLICTTAPQVQTAADAA